MCGIAGLYTKTPEMQARLGEYLARMLEQLSFRGPDSAGAAFYRDPAPDRWCKLSLHCAGEDPEWPALGGELHQAFGGASEPQVRATHAVFTVAADALDAQAIAPGQFVGHRQAPWIGSVGMGCESCAVTISASVIQDAVPSANAA